MPDRTEPSVTLMSVIRENVNLSNLELANALDDSGWMQYLLSEPGACKIIRDFDKPSQLKKLDASQGHCPEFTAYYDFECAYDALPVKIDEVRRLGKPIWVERFVAVLANERWQAIVQKHMAELLEADDLRQTRCVHECPDKLYTTYTIEWSEVRDRVPGADPKTAGWTSLVKDYTISGRIKVTTFCLKWYDKKPRGDGGRIKEGYEPPVDGGAGDVIIADKPTCESTGFIYECSYVDYTEEKPSAADKAKAEALAIKKGVDAMGSDTMKKRFCPDDCTAQYYKLTPVQCTHGTKQVKCCQHYMYTCKRVSHGCMAPGGHGCADAYGDVAKGILGERLRSSRWLSTWAIGDALEMDRWLVGINTPRSAGAGRDAQADEA